MNLDSSQRNMGIVRKFVEHVLPGVVKPLHVLWNEVIGFLFLAFGVLLIRPVYHSYRDLDGDPANLVKLALSAFFMLVMMFFGVHSFWKARRIARRP